MKKNFKDPIKPEMHSKEKKSPWNFDQPAYDERTSCYVNAGSHYGKGFKQPVGSKSHSDKTPIPFGRGPHVKVDEVPRGNLPIEVNL